jgi:hypothetical protein
MRLGLVPRHPPRAPGDGESAWAACRAGTRVCAAKAKRGHAHGREESSGRLPWPLTGTETQGKRENWD